MPPSAAPEWLRTGWIFETSATSAPASCASIAARIPAQPAPITSTSCFASTASDGIGTAAGNRSVPPERLEKACAGNGSEAAMDREVRGPTTTGARRSGLAEYARRPAVLIATFVALAIVIGLILWLLLRGGGTTSAKPVPLAPASAASIERLDAFASSVGHPIYWAGSQPSYRYELSRTKDGRVYIRYLPPGVKLGDPHPRYLTIGTYPQT